MLLRLLYMGQISLLPSTSCVCFCYSGTQGLTDQNKQTSSTITTTLRCGVSTVDRAVWKVTMTSKALAESLAASLHWFYFIHVKLTNTTITASQGSTEQSGYKAATAQRRGWKLTPGLDIPTRSSISALQGAFAPATAACCGSGSIVHHSKY